MAYVVGIQYNAVLVTIHSIGGVDAAWAPALLSNGFGVRKTFVSQFGGSEVALSLGRLDRVVDFAVKLSAVGVKTKLVYSVLCALMEPEGIGREQECKDGDDLLGGHDESLDIAKSRYIGRLVCV